MKDAIYHIASLHPEKDITILKRELINEKQKYRTYNFNIRAKDITNINNIAVDEKQMTLSMIKTHDLEGCSPFSKVQKHENPDRRHGTARKNIFPEMVPDGIESYSDLPSELKDIEHNEGFS